MPNMAAEAYKRQQIMTATPEALTLMLYNGCLRFMNEGKEHLEKKEWEAANNALIRAQKIITEFRVTLDMQYDIAKQLLPLYNYVYDCLVQANMNSDPQKVDDAYAVIIELRDAWAQAMKKARVEKAEAEAKAKEEQGAV